MYSIWHESMFNEIFQVVKKQCDVTRWFCVCWRKQLTFKSAWNLLVMKRHWNSTALVAVFETSSLGPHWEVCPKHQYVLCHYLMLELLEPEVIIPIQCHSCHRGTLLSSPAFSWLVRSEYWKSVLTVGLNPLTSQNPSHLEPWNLQENGRGLSKSWRTSKRPTWSQELLTNNP